MIGQIQQQQRRGQPVVIICLVLAAWAVMRSMLWQSPFPIASALIKEVAEQFVASNQQGGHPQLAKPDPAVILPPAAPRRAGLPRELYRGAIQTAEPGLAAATYTLNPQNMLTAPGDEILWMAATSALPVAPEVGAAYGAWRAPRVPFRPKAGRSGWSADGWILYRLNSRSGLAATQGPTSYGASQAGVALRYRMSAQSAYRPEAYLRATTAISQSEREVALGLSARPIGTLPVRVAGELRYSKLEAGSEFRPAVIANSELAPIGLPAGFRAEIYAQAGYIGGSNSTGFIDGQAAVMRQVARFDLGTVSAGGGAWGGAQKGAARVDVGPAVAFDFEVSDVRARLQVDYRLKVAGDAQPGSGPAITLTTGF